MYLCLTTLDIGSKNIGDNGAKYLSEALKVNQCLTKLDIDGNNIGADGAKYLAEALQVNCSLVESDLGFRVSQALKCSVQDVLNRNKALQSNRDTANQKSVSLKDKDRVLIWGHYGDENKISSEPLILNTTVLFSFYLLTQRQMRCVIESSPLNASQGYIPEPVFIFDASKILDLRFSPQCFLTDCSLYRCGICFSVCSKPCGSEKCDHIFCQKCIRNWKTKSSACPICREISEEWKFVPAIEHDINQLPVYCHFHCGWQGSLCDFEQSHYIECPERLGHCSLCEEEQSYEHF
jgi:hypothetical protein